MSVVERMSAGPESRFTGSTVRCPHPDKWSSTDPDSTEIEVSELVAGFVRGLQPDIVVETGTAWGQTAEAIGETLLRNGHGHLFTFEVDGTRVNESRIRCEGLPVSVIREESLVGIGNIIDGPVGFAWLDSLFELRPAELEVITPKMAPGAIVGVHDCGDKFASFHATMIRTASRLGYRHITLPTPRGVTFLEAPS